MTDDYTPEEEQNVETAGSGPPANAVDDENQAIPVPAPDESDTGDTDTGDPDTGVKGDPPPETDPALPDPSPDVKPNPPQPPPPEPDPKPLFPPNGTSSKKPPGDPEAWERQYIENVENKSVLNLRMDETPQTPVLKDPTQPFVRPVIHSKPGYRHLTPLAEKKARRLRDEGVLLIACTHENILQSASINVAYDGIFSGLQRRILDLGFGKDTRALDVLLDMNSLPIIGETAPGRRDGGGNTIIFIDIQEQESLTYFERYATFLARTRFWRPLNLYYLFRVSGKALSICTVGLSPLTSLPEWHIDALSTIVQDCIDRMEESTTVEADHIIEAVRQGAQEGLWPDEDMELIKDVEGVIEHGSDPIQSLMQEIEKRRDQRPKTNSDAVTLFKQANIAQRAAIFLAVYFSNCTIQEFDRVIKYLLENETVETTVTEDVPLPDSDKMATKTTTREVDAYQWWQKHLEEMIPHLQLKFSPPYEGKTCIRLAQPAMRGGFEEAIHPITGTRFFNKLHHAGLFFNPNASKTIVDALSKLTAKMCESHGLEYDENWLIDLLDDAMLQFKNYAQEAGRDILFSDDTEEADLKEWLQTLAKEWTSYYFQIFSRLGQLCRDLLQNPRNARITHAFINQLIQRTQPNGLMALELISRLRVPLGLDQTMAILHHLLEVGNTETCQRAIEILLEEMAQSAQYYWSVLQGVASWHPPRDINGRQPLSNAHHWSLGFLYILYDEQRRIIRKGRDDHLPFLLSDENTEDLPFFPDRLKMIAKWLSHPHFNNSIHTVIRKSNPDLYHHIVFLSGDINLANFCIAQMLEFWNFEYSETPIFYLTNFLADALPKRSLIELRKIIRKFADSMIYFISLSKTNEERIKFKNKRNAAHKLSSRLIKNQDRVSHHSGVGNAI